jgi:hypothetical protein
VGCATAAILEEGARIQGLSSTSVIYCDTARQLLTAFGDAIQQSTLLREQQFHCILNEDSNASRFDALIQEANERKQNAKYAYLNHLQRHGCVAADDKRVVNQGA